MYKDDVLLKIIELGDLRDKKDRELQTRKSAFILKLEPQSKYDFFVMHESYGSISTIWSIQIRQYFEEMRSIENGVWGLVSGVIITLCLYNLMLFFATRELAFLSYVGMSLSLLVYQLNINGVLYQFLGNVNLQYLNNLSWFIGFLSLVFSILFPLQFFKPSKKTFIFKYLVFMLFVYMSITLLYAFAFEYPELRYYTKYTDIAAFMLIPSLIGTSIWALKKKLSGAIFYLFGQVVYLSALLYVFMITIGYFKMFESIWLLLPIGITFDALFLLLALFAKLQEINKEKKENEELIISQARFTAMGQTIANMTHQWKTPISQLGSQIFLLEATHEIDKTNFATIWAQTLPKMKESIVYLKDTINDIYNFYSSPLQKEKFSFKDEIESLLRILHDEITSNKISLIKDIDDLNYYSYRSSFLNVLMIILENSIYQLTHFKDKDRVIKISLKKLEHKIKIDIEDNGGGLKQSDLKKLFDSYFSSKKGAGSGVGLVLAKKLLDERLKGTIEAKKHSCRHSF